ncbi:MAG: gfo/Idh/MocA family oxidoreductase, partial [Spirochaetaceae bacterium]
RPVADLKALVYGTGFAGQGHARALAACGVDVVCLVGRTSEVTGRVAGELGIPDQTTNLAAAFARHRPDLIAIGTPGGAHVAPVELAAKYGTAVYCDKPLAPDSATAQRLYELTRDAGVKTAYAASFRYQPQVRFAADLVGCGQIGRVLEVECVSHYDLNPLIPHSWSHLLAEGGGRLNNNFTHKLSIVEAICGSAATAVCGETRNDMQRAPVAESTHDFRTREETAPTENELDGVEWRQVDSDWSYTVMARMADGSAAAGTSGASLAGDPTRPASALFRHSGLQPRHHDDSIVVYGTDGALALEGAYATGRVFVRSRTGRTWVELPIPESIVAGLPQIADNAQRNWTALMRELVADLRGEQSEPYQTFFDGWRYQVAIDAVRAACGWTELPTVGRA